MLKYYDSSMKDALKIINRGTDEILTESDLKKKLDSGKQLLVKAGFDPTAPDLHFGHTVLAEPVFHFGFLDHLKSLGINNKMNFRKFDDGSIGISLDETTTQSDIKKICDIFGVKYSNTNSLLYRQFS